MLEFDTMYAAEAHDIENINMYFRAVSKTPGG